MRFHLPSFWDVKSRSDKICPVEPGRHSVVKTRGGSQVEITLPHGGELRSLVFFSISFISSWVAVALLLCCESVVLNKSILLPGWLSLLGFGDTLELLLGEELTHQYLNNLNLILNCDLHPNIFNLEKSDTTVDLSSTPSATYDSFTSTTK